MIINIQYRIIIVAVRDIPTKNRGKIKYRKTVIFFHDDYTFQSIFRCGYCMYMICIVYLRFFPPSRDI